MFIHTDGREGYDTLAVPAFDLAFEVGKFLDAVEVGLVGEANLYADRIRAGVTDLDLSVGETIFDALVEDGRLSPAQVARVNRALGR